MLATMVLMRQKLLHCAMLPARDRTPDNAGSACACPFAGLSSISWIAIASNQITVNSATNCAGSEKLGRAVKHFRAGDRVGIPVAGWTCGRIKFSDTGSRNLCDRAGSPATIRGLLGFASRRPLFFIFPSSSTMSPAAHALCSRLIGCSRCAMWRSQRLGPFTVRRRCPYRRAGLIF